MELYRSKRVAVYREKARLQNGSVLDMEVVHTHDSVIVLPVLGRDLLLTREFRPIIGKWLWSVPAGTIEKGERPLHCAKREVIEEAGYIPGKITPLFQSYSSPGIITERLHFFLAESLERSGQRLEKDEQISIKRVSMAKALQMIRTGHVGFGPAVQVILFYAMLKREHGAKAATRTHSTKA